MEISPKPRRGRILALVFGACLMLNGCGDSRIERAGSGAAIGAGIGIASGFVCCNNPGQGTQNGLIIGAAAGALIGFLIDSPLFFNSGN